ncbi:MAG: flagellin [Bacteroidota bacterium]|nr:flagellin [Bacteroidota bacterium]
MPFGDLTRINSDSQSLGALNSLFRINRELGIRQNRLSTGYRINSAEDDSAGYALGKKLESRIRGLSAALDNIGDAKNMLSVAEGGLQSIMDILQTIKEKVTRGANDTMGSEERAALVADIRALGREIDQIVAQTKYNNRVLLRDFNTSASALQFHVGPDNSDTITFSLASGGSTTTFQSSGLLGGVVTGSGALSSTASAASFAAALASIDSAITTVSSAIRDLGAFQRRLTVKEDMLSAQITNTEGARSRVFDADFAREQLRVAKLQILQQTATVALAQANANPQAVLSLFR